MKVALAILVLGLASLGFVRPSNELPDLVITGMSFTPERITTPTDVLVHVVIENCGEVPYSNGVDIGVNVKGPGGWEYGVAAYAGRVPPPGEILIGSARIDDVPCPGRYLVLVDVDPFGSVPEEDEENNSYKGRFVAE